MPAGHEVAAVNLSDGFPARDPLVRWRRRHAGADGTGQLLAAGQLAVSDRAAIGGDDASGLGLERLPIGLPARSSQIDQHLARRGCGARQLRGHGRCGPRPERSLIERREVRVGHHERDRVERRAQLVGDDLRKRRARVLTNLDFAGVSGDPSICADVDPRCEIARSRSILAGPARFLRLRIRHRRHDEQAASHRREDAQEVAPIDLGQLEEISPRLRQFVPFELVVGRHEVCSSEAASIASVLRAARRTFDAASLIAATMRG